MLLAVVVAGLLGCGSNAPDDPLIGTWDAPLDVFGCANAMTFNGEKASVQFACLQPDGSFADMIHGGPYTTTSDGIDITVTKSSCPSDLAPDTTMHFGYSFSGGSLFVSRKSGGVLLERDTSTGGTGVLVTGCITADSTHTFTPGPVVDL